MGEEVIKTILELEDIQKIQPDFSQLKIINKETAERIQVLIFAKENTTLQILTTNNFTKSLNKILSTLEEKGFKHQEHYTSIEGFNFALTRYDKLEEERAQTQKDIKEQRQAGGKSAIEMIRKLFDTRSTMDPGQFITEVIRLSFQTGASDLHFQPELDKVEMLIRIDGVIQKIVEFTIDDFEKYLQKIMFLSGAKLNVDYIPQDGRFSFEAIDLEGKTRQIDARVSLIPSLKLPSTVIRFLDATMGIKGFEEIGFSGRNYDTLKRNILKNTGVTIFTGPTGSGKSTTLYSILNYLNNGEKKIITLEDPVEYQIAGIQQSQINSAKGYTYELGLKAILRHDPDIILIGEIRSKETAEIGINAALTGHLVFTTLHTNSAIEGISRLINMGVKLYMIAPSVNLIVGQRLVRRVCPHCNIKIEASYGEKEEIMESVKRINESNAGMNLEFDGRTTQAVGCEKCNKTGYIGRITVVEAFEITEDIKRAIIEGKSTLDLYAIARQAGYLTLKEDGIIRVLNGETTMDEIRRVL
ncbi:GspE/PulE family protein [Candidatus Gracilibacteria bacterium]|nr:GspE/PulE family protein [Candidatus Gracilibacteria bacterium]